MQAMTTTAFVHGFSSTAMLIMAIGAQNAFVLRQGLRREHVLPVVALCALSDAVLLQAALLLLLFWLWRISSRSRNAPSRS